RTAVPPSRPATQASDSASRLASCSRATLTCGIRLPGGDQLMELGGVGRGEHRFAQRPVAEHLRQLREDLQVLFGGLLRHQQDEGEAHRLAVGRLERHRLRETHEGAERLLQALDAAVRDRDALAEAGRAELLAREQAVEHGAAADLVVVLEEQTRLLEQALLARRLQVGDDVTRTEDVGDQTHVRFSYSLSL